MRNPPEKPVPNRYADLSPEALKALADKREAAVDAVSAVTDKANRARQDIIDKMR